MCAHATAAGDNTTAAGGDASAAPSHSCVRAGDCFVLDTNADLVLQWTGASAAPTLAYKALDFANQLRDDTHAGSGRVAALRQSDSDGADLAAFYKALGVTDAKSVTVADAKSDPAAVSTPPKLYEVKFSGSGASAKHTVTKSDEALTVAALQPDRTLVLVASGSTWVWTGRAVPSDLKQKPFGLAAEALAATKPKSKKKSSGGESPAASCPVIVTQQGLEGPLFKAQFSDWSAKEAEALGARKVAEAAGESAPSQEDAEVDVAALVAGASTEVRFLCAARELLTARLAATVRCTQGRCAHVRKAGACMHYRRASSEFATELAECPERPGKCALMWTHM